MIMRTVTIELFTLNIYNYPKSHKTSCLRTINQKLNNIETTLKCLFYLSLLFDICYFITSIKKIEADSYFLISIKKKYFSIT